MIRRGFWVALGAALGVAGYRRAGRLARALRPAVAGARPGRGGSGPGRGQTGRAARSGVGGPHGAAAFLRDVRDGMDEYLEHRQGQQGPTLEGQRPPGPAGPG